MKKVILNIIGITVSLISIICAFIFYKSVNNTVIYTEGDSYASKYASQNLMRKFDVSDSHKNLFNYDLEIFSYNIVNNKIEITKYEGISSELVIPSNIEGIVVEKITKDSLNDNVKTIVIPKTINYIDEDILKSTTIKCYNNDYCKSLKETYDVEILSDSDNYNFDNSKLDFTYNIDEYVTITNYIGKDDLLIIPNHINGYEVKSLDFDGISLRGIYIPKTVTEISANFTSEILNRLFIYSTVITLVSLLIFSIVVSSLTEEKNQKHINYAIGLVSIIYLALITLIVYKIRINPMEYRNYTIISIIIAMIYLIIDMLARYYISKSNKYDKKIKNIDSFIKEAIAIAEDSDFDLNDIKDELRYSDVISIAEVKEIEDTIILKLKALSEENIGESKKEISKLIKKRNRIIKNNK